MLCIALHCSCIGTLLCIALHAPAYAFSPALGRYPHIRQICISANFKICRRNLQICRPQFFMSANRFLFGKTHLQICIFLSRKFGLIFYLKNQNLRKCRFAGYVGNGLMQGNMHMQGHAM